MSVVELKVSKVSEEMEFEVANTETKLKKPTNEIDFESAECVQLQPQAPLSE